MKEAHAQAIALEKEESQKREERLKRKKERQQQQQTEQSDEARLTAAFSLPTTNVSFAQMVAQQRQSASSTSSTSASGATNSTATNSDAAPPTLIPRSELPFLAGKRKRANSNAYANPLLLSMAEEHPNTRKIVVEDEPTPKKANSMSVDEPTYKKKRRTVIVRSLYSRYCPCVEVCAPRQTQVPRSVRKKLKKQQKLGRSIKIPKKRTTTTTISSTSASSNSMLLN